MSGFGPKPVELPFVQTPCLRVCRGRGWVTGGAGRAPVSRCPAGPPRPLLPEGPQPGTQTPHRSPHHDKRHGGGRRQTGASWSGKRCPASERELAPPPPGADPRRAQPGGLSRGSWTGHPRSPPGPGPASRPIDADDGKPSGFLWGGTSSPPAEGSPRCHPVSPTWSRQGTRWRVAHAH